MAHISGIKLIRTDTTLDLSQKAEKGFGGKTRSYAIASNHIGDWKRQTPFFHWQGVSNLRPPTWKSQAQTIGPPRREEDKIFENTLATNEDNNNLLEEMAKALPGKSL
ncbi:hypothetical protein H5410_055485 [Solanum commersonii]|uniref:Uncharacterized protein n=1 Tax=Solanum commersonii TaxID=4109 RepID=A0A9J5WJ93_SOLCO|nr:hypothetical protein H5410_055485 [Solanum commersonii]